MGVPGLDHGAPRRIRGAVLLLGVFAVVGCAEQVAVPPPTASIEGSREPSPALTATPTSNPTLETSVPPELAGTWRRSVAGETVDLSLQIGYSIQRGFGRGSGRVAVDGDRIEFFASDRCEGAGDYTWTVEGDVLTLTMVGTDPCSGRSEVLIPGSFRRYEP